MKDKNLTATILFSVIVAFIVTNIIIDRNIENKMQEYNRIIKEEKCKRMEPIEVKHKQKGIAFLCKDDKVLVVPHGAEKYITK